MGPLPFLSPDTKPERRPNRESDLRAIPLISL